MIGDGVLRVAAVCIPPGGAEFRGDVFLRPAATRVNPTDAEAIAGALSAATRALGGARGFVSLAGIVVNNAIVLIDTINRYRRCGLEKREAVIRAGDP